MATARPCIRVAVEGDAALIAQLDGIIAALTVARDRLENAFRELGNASLEIRYGVDDPSVLELDVAARDIEPGDTLLVLGSLITRVVGAVIRNDVSGFVELMDEAGQSMGGYLLTDRVSVRRRLA